MLVKLQALLDLGLLASGFPELPTIKPTMGPRFDFISGAPIDPEILFFPPFLIKSLDFFFFFLLEIELNNDNPAPHQSLKRRLQQY